MKKVISAAILILLMTIKISAFAEEPKVSARSAIAVDAQTFGIIFEKNADEKLPMASTTKIITAITAIENGNLEDTVTVSENAANTEGSSVWLEAGEQLTLIDLLYALMLESGNDAAVAIAEHISGSQENFAALMNDTCKKAGAYSTNCVTPNGLDDDEHYTTARDLALISRYAMKSDIFRTIVSTQSKSIPWEAKEWNRELLNHNKLLNIYDGALGIKTGFTKKSGRCLVSAAKRGELETIVVTLNDPDDWTDHKNLLDYSFEQFSERDKILEKGKSLGEIYVKESGDTSVSYSADSDFYARKTTDIKMIKPVFHLKSNIQAPLKKGDIVGCADIYNGNLYLGSVNLVSDQEVRRYSTADLIKKNYKYFLEILLCLVRE